jgi:predicted transcriptional regulator
MKVTINVETREQSIARTLAAVHAGRAATTAYITFLTAEDLLKTLTPLRWLIIQQMTGAGPMSIRELARRVGRDVKRVHEDVHALLNTGVLDRAESGEIVFPYDKVHVDFEIKAEAA